MSSLTAGANKCASRAVVVLQLAAWSAVGVVLLQKGVASLQKTSDAKNATKVNLTTSHFVFGQPVLGNPPEREKETSVPPHGVRLTDSERTFVSTNDEGVPWKDGPTKDFNETDAGEDDWNRNLEGKTEKDDQRTNSLVPTSIEKKKKKKETLMKTPQSSESSSLNVGLSSEEEGKEGVTLPIPTKMKTSAERKQEAWKNYRKKKPMTKEVGEPQEEQQWALRPPTGKDEDSSRTKTESDASEEVEDAREEGPKTEKNSKSDSSSEPNGLPVDSGAKQADAASVPGERRRKTDSSEETRDPPSSKSPSRESATETRRKMKRLSHLSAGGAAAAIAMVAVGAVMLILGPAVIILRAIDERRQERRFLKLSAQDDLPPTYEQATLMDEAPRYSTLSLNTIFGPPPPPSPSPRLARAHVV